MITIRPAFTLDAASMAQLLNAIIEAGGTTARTREVTAADMRQAIAQDPDRCAWHVALDSAERVAGFQHIESHPDLPPEACDIATFVEIGRTGLGIGSKLFDATRKSAKALGYTWINANIRSDNEGGLIYYQSRGFSDYGVIEGYRLDNGQLVDKTLKRFDL